MPPWWGTRGGRYWSNCKAEQDQFSLRRLITNTPGRENKELLLLKAWGQPAPRGGSMGGRARREGSTTGLIRSASCPRESEATPAFSLIKNIFKTSTERLQREPKCRERGSAQRSRYKTSLKLHSWKERKFMFLFPCPRGQGAIGIHIFRAISVSRPTPNPFKLLKSTGTHDFKNENHHCNPGSFPVGKDFILLGDLVKGYDSSMRRAATAPLMSLERSLSLSEQWECHRAVQNSNTNGARNPRRWQWWLQQTQNKGPALLKTSTALPRHWNKGIIPIAFWK